MQRIPEPELMDEPAQARAYADADFEEPNREFVERALEWLGDLPENAAVLDLGCGPGDITLRLARALPNARVHGLDGSPAMLAIARQRLAPEGDGRVAFLQGLVPGAELPLQSYDAIVSNSLLHHLHSPAGFWEMIADTGAPGAPVVVMDLFRPADPVVAEQLVETYAAGEPEVLRKDFHASLLAAFEPGEVHDQLAACRLEGFSVEAVSDRHMLIRGRLPD